MLASASSSVGNAHETTDFSLVGLRIVDPKGRVLVDRVDLEAGPGEALMLIGETGSGKSLIAQAMFGLLPKGFSISGILTVNDTRLRLEETAALQRLWGRHVFLIPQEPGSALDPTMRIGRQIGEGTGLSKAAVSRLMRQLDLPDSVAASYPYRLSGGMAQRALVACALGHDAKLIAVDEPTKGLDADRIKAVIGHLNALLAAGRTLIVITHDFEVVRRVNGKLAVLHDGKIVERGPARETLDKPQHDYTRLWLAAHPSSWPKLIPQAKRSDPLVAVEGLAAGHGGAPLFQNLNFTIGRGEIVGLHGSSGSGKTTLGNVILGLHRPSAGLVRWDGEEIWRQRTAIRRKRQGFQKLHQDPMRVFLPHRTIGHQLLDLAQVTEPSELEARIAAFLQRLCLSDELLDRLPGEISGGEAQRLALLRLLLLRPRFIAADEPTSRLDPIVQSATVTLLTGLVREAALGLLLISHDRTLLEKVADRIISLTD